MSRVCAGLLTAFLLAAAPSFAGETADIAIRSCHEVLNLTDAICNCIGARAEQELNPQQQQFFIAAITEDRQGQAALRANMTVAEMTQVAMFMSTSPQECAAQ